jgi:hypothetical protein
LIAFSESNVVEKETRTQLEQYGKEQLVWLNSLESNGELNSLGWHNSKQVTHLDHAVSLSRGKSTVWVYFQILNNYRLMRILHTDFAKKYPDLISSIVQKQNTTTKTIIKNSGMSLTDFKARSYDINSEKIEKLPENFPAAEFGLLLKTKEQFNHLIKNLNSEWSPFKAFDPYTIMMWDRVAGRIIPEVPNSFDKGIVLGNIKRIENSLENIRHELYKF